jgi:outer membrane receptor protein involved in Fe transport
MIAFNGRVRISKGRLTYSVAASALLLSLAGQASAQSAAASDTSKDAPQSAEASPEGGEIVVTATRRGDIKTRDIPLAITAVSADALKQANVSSLQDLRKVDPSLNITAYGAGQQRTVIRGIQAQTGATTGLYLDEMPISASTGASVGNLGDGRPALQLYDIDHVEILKGPQGTLFGSGSVSGTLRVITAKPNLTTIGGHAEGSIGILDGGNPTYNGSATLNLPVVNDVLAVRGVVWGQTGGGYIDQTINGSYRSNVNDTITKGFRASLLFKPTSDLSVFLSAMHQDINVKGSGAWQQNLGAYNTNSPSSEFFREHVELYNATVDYNLGFGSLVATGSYGKQSNISGIDSSPTGRLFGLPGGIFVPTNDNRYSTAELRFSSKFKGPFQVVAGAFYEHDKNLAGTNAIIVNSLGLARCYTYDECNANGFRKPGFGNSDYEFGSLNTRVSDQYTAYIQGDLEITHSLVATVGFRYFSADTHLTTLNRQTVFPDFFFGILSPLQTVSDRKASDKKPSYNFSLLWKATPDINFYARAASGFRIGGVNSTTSLAQQIGIIFPEAYGPDSLWNYEIGAKGTILDHKLSFDLSLYHIDWTGQQSLASAAGGAFGYVINAGLTRTNGAELNFSYRPSSHLTLGGGATYVDAKLATDLPAEVVATGTVGRKGDRLPFVAKLTATGFIEYRGDTGRGVEAYGRASVNYRSSSYSSFSPASTFYTKMPQFAMAGAEIGIRTARADYGISVENLTNKVAYLGVYDSIDGIRIYSPGPRTIRMKAALRF